MILLEARTAGQSDGLPSTVMVCATALPVVASAHDNIAEATSFLAVPQRVGFVVALAQPVSFFLIDSSFLRFIILFSFGAFESHGSMVKKSRPAAIGKMLNANGVRMWLAYGSA